MQQSRKELKVVKLRQMKPQPYDPNEFPTLVKYQSQQIEDAVQKLMKEHSMTRQQAMVNLEQDMSEIEAQATGK